MKIFVFLLFIFICTPSFAQDDIDMFGGWTGLQSATTYAVTGNNAESIAGMILTDTGAFAGKDLTNMTIQPDVDDYMYFIINGNDDDNLYIEPCDRLTNDVIANGDMELDSDWDNYNTPTENKRTRTGAVVGTYTRQITGDAADDGVQQTGLTIQGARSGFEYNWYGSYKSIGLIKVVSGTVNMSISDSAGSLYNAQVGTTDGGVWESFEVTTSSSTYEGAGTGSIEFYCSGGACDFYIDEIVVGESGYGYYNVYVGLDDYNTGTQEYAVYGNWRVEQIENRWWMIDPLDNVFFMKGMNNADTLLIKGADFDGNDLCDNMDDKYGVAATCGTHVQERLQSFKDYGFNNLGSILSGYSTLTSIDRDLFPPIPYVSQVRVRNWEFTSDVGEFQLRGTSYDDEWPDTYDADWEGKFNDYPNGIFATSWGFGSINYELKSGDVTPYRKIYLDKAANIWFQGYDLDEEPPGSGSGYGHLGYYIFCSQVTDTSSDDSVNDTLIAMVNWLRSKYTAGSETAFVANIGYDGSDEITALASWSGVTGYVDAAADAAALAILNTAWGTTYTTWTEVIEENGEDGDAGNFGFETQSDCTGTETSCRMHNASPDAELLADMDDLQGNYFRKYMYPFYTHLFEDYFRGTKLDFGPGMSYYPGWGKGSMSVDGLIKYMDIFYTHGVGGTSGALGGLDDAPFPSEAGQTNFNRIYNINNIPVIHESLWVTAETDTQMGFRGTVDKIYNEADVDYAVYRGVYDGESVTQIADDAAITWKGGSDTGTLWWQFDGEDDTTGFGSCKQTCGVSTGECCDYFANEYIIIADSGSIGNLENDDVITDGINSFVINGTPERSSMLVDADANFDTDANNPKALNELYYWAVIVNEDDPSPVRYYMTRIDYTTDRSILFYLSFGTDVSGGYDSDGYVDMAAGDNYYMTFLFQDGATWRPEQYIIQDQGERANYYTSILRQTFENGQGSDGVYYDMGFHQFSPWDYGFGEYKTIEIRNFGFFSVKDNAYDGVEATTLGADGIAGTADDEEGDYGDFVTPMSNYLNNIYQELQPKHKSNGVSFNGASFN